MMEKSKYEKIMDITTKRGFFYPSAEIYGAKAGFWTYGHLGTKIKHKWEGLWRKFFLSLDTNFYEIDDVNIMPKKVFESSGHLKNFTDPLTECEKCHFRFRADQLAEDELKIDVAGLREDALTKLIRDNKLKCPKCKGSLMDVKFFNMMFDIRVGAVNEEIMYLRPESAQSPYMAFRREFEATRRKLPLGLAVIGRAFRNEISPRQGFFRLREFTQAELQIFFDAEKINEHENWSKINNYNLIVFSDKKAKKISCKEMNEKLKIPKFYIYYMAKVQQFYLDVLKIPENRLRFRELGQEERAFYNKIHFDIEINLETLGGWKEVGGCHFRGTHDLGGHQTGSGTNLEITVDEEGRVKRFLPSVLELSFGVDRNIWALIDIFYKEEKERTTFSFTPQLSPIDAAVFPLVNKDKLPDISENIFMELFRSGFSVLYDNSGSIGKRYRRQDEIGTNICITVDFDSLNKNDITIRDRDTMKQIRLKNKDLKETLNKLRSGAKLSDFGKFID
mgnify:CR=1 FL=1